MMYHHKTTGFEMGNPDIIPLSPAAGGLPVREEVTGCLKSMILSASGWRKVFAVSGQEEDNTPLIGSAHTVIAALIADTFGDYMIDRCGSDCTIAVGIDARPTGTAIADTMLRVLAGKGITLQYLFITAAPEIMAYSRKVDGFVYISASHNPIGHNGIKFGLNDGGVLPGSETSKLADTFKSRCSAPDVCTTAAALVSKATPSMMDAVYTAVENHKKAAVEAYRAFTGKVVSGVSEPAGQQAFFNMIRTSTRNNPLTVVCDMNGSARTLSIDKTFLADCGIGFTAINDNPRQIVHTIIPEPENLVYCAREMIRLKPEQPAVTLGYMPDCDGDRGNIVYWNNKTGTADVLKAQEVFALSVLSELAWLEYRTGGDGKTAVAVNDPTSMRIEDITAAFGARTVRAEVGEANVVNLAREMRTAGYTVPILGEGSNGGNITHPAAVRDPLNTIFALIKLLVIKDTVDVSGTNKPGLFHLWCIRSRQEQAYRDDFTLADIIETLPVYTTTGVSESRALMHINTTDHALLKKRFQQEFERSWAEKKDRLLSDFGIATYEAICNNGTKETRNITDYSLSGRGGLKILFKDSAGQPSAYIWMRGSGTEPVFRILCDVKGNRPDMESSLLEWETELLLKADTPDEP